MTPCPEVTSDEDFHERQNLNKCMRQWNLGIQKNPFKNSLRVLIISEKIVNETTLKLRSPCIKRQHKGTLYEIHSVILAWLLKWQKDIAGESGEVWVKSGGLWEACSWGEGVERSLARWAAAVSGGELCQAADTHPLYLRGQPKPARTPGVCFPPPPLSWRALSLLAGLRDRSQ